MFEKQLADDLHRIFKVKKVTYNQISESAEQECLFVEVENVKNTISPPNQRAMVTGTAVMVGQNDKLPFGFYSKAIQEAGHDLTKSFFFYDLESNTRRYQNIVQRGFSFVYFFDGQYDPKVGIINEVEFTFEES